MPENDSDQLKAAWTAVVEMVKRWCAPIETRETIFQNKYPRIDSGAMSAHATAMRVLATHGLMRIQTDVGRRVIATWTEAARDFGVDPEMSWLKEMLQNRQDKQPWSIAPPQAK
jgi:hypothetical protein